MRVTDRDNAPIPGGGSEAATVTDSTLAFVAPCTVTAGATGATCPLNTSANALSPGLVRDSKRMLIAMSQVQVHDGGADGLVATDAQRGVRRSGNLYPVGAALVPERELRVLGHALRGPHRREDHLREDLLDSLDLADELLHLLGDLRADRARGVVSVNVMCTSRSSISTS